MPTAPTIVPVSGNSFSVNVTPCGLDSDITLRDFVVLENGTLTANPSSYNKTSPTTIQYAGPTLPLTTLEVRRFTPRNQRQLAGVGITKISSQVWNREFDRRVRIQEEVDTFGAGGGFSIRLPIDAPYSVTWNGDTLFSPTRNSLYGVIQTLAPLGSPTFTGNPTVPTQLTGDDSTRIATTAHVKANLAAYAPLASPNLTGTPVAPTQLVSDNSTRIATTAYVKSNLVNTPLTGIPTAPTAATIDNTTTLATTAHVKNNLASYATLVSPTFTGVPITPTFNDGVKSTQMVNALNLQRHSRPIVVATRTGSNVPTLPGTAIDLVFNNVITDTSGVYNSSTGVFTAPYTGWYSWSVAIAVDSATLFVSAIVQTTGTELVRIGQQYSPSNQVLVASGTQLVFMNAGDTRKSTARTNVAANLFAESNTTSRDVFHMTIYYVGISTAT